MQASLDQSPARRAANGRRLWWLIALLLLMLNVLAWQRKSIAGWMGLRAMDRASHDDMSTARRWLNAAERVSPYAPEIALAAARIHRREGNPLEFGRELRRAESLGIDPERANRESVLFAAQSGQISVAGPKLASLLESAGGEEAEICEAYAKGYMRVRDFPSALAMLNAWAGDLPKDARPHAWIGQIQAELSANEQAEAAFRTALQLDPTNATAALGLGQLLVDLKRPADAIPWFQITVNDLALGASAAVGLSSALQAESRVEEAEAVVDHASRQFPNDYRLLVEKANIVIEQGRYAEAEELLRPEIQLGTNRRELRYAYAVALRGVGRTEEAASHFEYATEAARETAAANRLVNEVSGDPGNIELRFKIGQTLLRYGNVEDGLMWLQSVLDIAPQHQPTHGVLAEHYERQIARNPQVITTAQRHRSLAGARAKTEKPDPPANQSALPASPGEL